MQNSNQKKPTDKNVEMNDVNDVDNENARNPPLNNVLNLVSASITSSSVSQPSQSLNNREANP